jgi:O-antigen/teichoic acid export membrane protein
MDRLNRKFGQTRPSDGQLMGIFATTVHRARHVFEMHSVLLANSSALTVGAIATAALGFAFWWLAARYFSPHSVGLASAAISIMNLIGLVSESGLGTLLIGESLRRGKNARGLISAALMAAFVSSTLLGIVCLALASKSPFKLGRFLEFPDSGAFFIAGCAITGFTLVLDSALVGLLRSSLQMYRSVAFSALKLALLFAAALAAHVGGQEVWIFLAWVLGMLLSIVFLVLFLFYGGYPAWAAPDFSILKALAPSVLGHHLLNLATQGPGLILPFLVTVVLAADVNAAFYIAWMVLNVVLLIPASLTTTLFTIGSIEPSTIASRLRFSLWLCALTSFFAGAGAFFLSGLILLCFGPSYASLGGPVLQILGVVVFPVTLKYHYIAIQRLRGHMTVASLLLGAGGILELALAIFGGRLGGLAGFTCGWVAAVYLEALLLIPALIHAAGGVEMRVFRVAVPAHPSQIPLDNDKLPNPRRGALPNW